MINRTKKFVHKVREGSEHHKTMWTWLFSMVAFSFIVVSWGTYKTRGFSAPPIIAIEAENTDPGMIDKVKLGLATTIATLKEVIDTENVIEVRKEFNNQDEALTFPK